MKWRGRKGKILGMLVLVMIPSSANLLYNRRSSNMNVSLMSFGKSPFNRDSRVHVL